MSEPSYSVQLVACGRRKVEVISVVREHTGLGLKEAKDLVESAPATVQSGLTSSRASALADKLRRVGATVEMTDSA